jgi:hypothetical protein
MKNKKSILIFTAMMTLILANFGVSNVRKDRKSVNNLSALLHEAKAGDESVTCNYDPGDKCVVGTTTVRDYDEGCASWFWG